MTPLSRNSHKVYFPAAIFIAGLVIFVFIKLYNQRNIASNGVDERLRSAAGSLELVINDDLIEKTQKKEPLDIVSEDSIRLLANRIAEIHNVVYVYVMIKSNDSVYFVLSSFIDKDITNNMVTKNLDYYVEGTAVMKNAFTSTEAEVYEAVSDQWGTFRSVYLPRKTKSGVPYLLCADVALSEVVDYQLNYLIEFAISAIFLFLISLPLFLWFRNNRIKS